MGRVLSRSLPLSISLLVSFLISAPGCNPPSERGDERLQSEVPPGGVRGEDRYVLTVLYSSRGPTLFRTDTSTCRVWKMQLQEGKWQAIAPETRAPGEGLPVRAGRYVVSRVRSKQGSVLLCNDVKDGYVYRMLMSGEEGWEQIEEPDDRLGKLDRIPLSPPDTEGSEPPDEAEPPGELEQSAESDAAAEVDVMRETIRDKSSPPEFRVFAATQLGNISSEETLPALIEALDDPDPAVVVAAIWALALNGDAEAIPELNKLLSHEDEEVRKTSQQVIEVLSK